MKIVLAFIFTLIFAVWGGVRTVDYVLYTINIEGYLKRAGDANSVELAKENLEAALNNIEAWGWTSGNTGILWNSPGNDVGFWYTNIKSALAELEQVQPEATQLEKTNILMKLRESILDDGESVNVTAPGGIYVFPHNTLFFFWAWISGILAVLFWFVVGVRDY